MAKPILSVEIEHIFNPALFGVDAIRAALARAGIGEDMRANKRLLLTDQETVNRIQDGPQGLKDGLIEGRGSIVRHEGATQGGNQLGMTFRIGGGGKNSVEISVWKAARNAVSGPRAANDIRPSREAMMPHRRKVAA